MKRWRAQQNEKLIKNRVCISNNEMAPVPPLWNKVGDHPADERCPKSVHGYLLERSSKVRNWGRGGHTSDDSSS